MESSNPGWAGRGGGTEGITEYNTLPYIGIADPYTG